MSRIPNFAKVGFADALAAGAPATAAPAPWLTPEGIAVKSV